MKSWALSLVLAMAGAVPAVAQHDHHSMPHKTGDARLEVRDAAGTLVVRLGPLNLPAHADHTQVAQPSPVILTIPFDGWITAYHPALVDDAGNRLTGPMLHHVAFWNTGRSDFLCPNKEEHIFGAGGEMNDWPPLPGFGYRVRPGDRIRITSMFHNPTAAGYPRAYLQVIMEYQLAGNQRALKSVYPAWFDVKECGNSGYDLAPGKSVTEGKVTVAFSGVLLGLGGHLHDYGRELRLQNDSRKEEVAELAPRADEKGRILSVPIVVFSERGGYRLSRGDVLRSTAIYENPTGQVLPEGAMGIVVGYFLPDDDTAMSVLVRKPRSAGATGN